MRRRPALGLLGAGLAAALAAVPAGAIPLPLALTEPAAFTEQALRWAPCTPDDEIPGLPRVFYRLQCSTFEAPADWSDPDGARVTIAVSRLPATRRPAAGVTFTNPGGPGEPGLELPLVIAMAGRTAMLRSQDLYGIDVRGTGSSTNLTCGGPNLLPLLDPRDRSSANLRLFLDNAELTARFCAGAPGLSSARVSTGATVQDLELLRGLVRAETINWLGYSAGTWLGAQYAATYPSRVGRFVYDSTVDVTGTWQQAFALQPMGFERRFREDFAPWVSRFDDDYGLGTTPAAVLDRYEKIRAGLTPEAPVDNAVLLDQILASSMYTSLAFPDAAATLADLETFTAAVARGDARAGAAARRRIAARPQLRAARQRVAARMPLSSDASDATFLAVTCNDTPWEGGRYGLVRSSGEQASSYPLLGPGTINEPCAFWPQPTGIRLADPARVAVPTSLVVQSEHDPATPVEGARRTVAALGSRLLLVRGEGDHALYAGGNPCVDRAVERFIVRGALPAAEATCASTSAPIPLSRTGRARPATRLGNPLVTLDELTRLARPGLSRRSAAAGAS